MATEATLAFGGNLGDPVAAFAAALRSLRTHPGIALGRLSSVWRTAPWGRTDQPEFLNMAAAMATTLSPEDLLSLCLALEQAARRERGERWGPRTLDIDILTYGTQTIDREGLQIPHPRMSERAFVLAPLAEIDPERLVAGRAVAAHLALLPDDGIRRDEAATERLSALLAA
ncbi:MULTISPECIES: 2-amino-4-hydroxy-6-hydroxymethyldihydropteridine diphosphokinase [unclassified Bosea (in: a-proteobacteria)]|uniref:2-amino-4-hydroxy-6- hydroxymethyldihydropteridine diphosphokinase n=1 Tax=unclassified Bosea (in: a-proteobacteria) TaxID=2653178 RepID=UPI000953D2E5|nr:MULTISPECIES: 2-amino-4-hydroxy-6-hydroxymethyldihydropteridine diphosphokinase [unclassified Bosea (in: a-proteobacteria)]SIQ66500.1 2-amino-4-hydroxy-6-hydroxymethyldihydropteridinediphosphokinase [Bosea sp. TND4EK4]